MSSMHIPSNKEVLLYAGYGSNRDPKMMKAIIGEKPTRISAVGGIALAGVDLYVQRLADIPDEVSPEAPVAHSPRQTIESVLGKNSEFYVIVPNEQHVGMVNGTLYELTEAQRALVDNFEFWKELIMRVEVIMEGSEPLIVETEGLPRWLVAGKQVSGGRYTDYLNDTHRTYEIARKTREDCLANLHKPEQA